MPKRELPYTILLVEDDADTLDVTSFILRHEGFTVETAINGKDAADKIAKEGSLFDAILFDVTIPKADIPVDFLEKHHQDIREVGVTHYANLLYLSDKAREKNEKVLPYLHSALTFETLRTLQTRIHAEGIFPKPYDFSSMANQLKATLLRKDYKKPTQN